MLYLKPTATRPALPPTVPALVLVVTLVAACSGPEVYKKSMEVAGYDFTEYTDQGFLITPESYQGEYQSIGVLSVTVWPRVERRPVEDDTLAQPGVDSPAQEWFITEAVDPQEVVDSLYVEAQSMGADAIMNFRAEPVREDLENGPTRAGVRARGFAIDRVDK
jgi:hypothetical protein